MTQSNQRNATAEDVAAEALLEARVCSKTYVAEGKQSQDGLSHLVLDDIQLTIHAGEFVALLGP